MNNATSDASPCRLVAVVVTHNRLSKLQTTLCRLLESPTSELAAVVVFDNASTDGTSAWLTQIAASDARVDIVYFARNIGGAGGFEQGMRHAVKNYDPDWLVVMDDDGRPETDALAQFHAADRSGAHGWGAACYKTDGTICDMNRPSINPFWDRAALRRTFAGQGRDGFHLGPNDYTSKMSRDVDGASFVGFFISRAGIALAGYPNGALFIYGDDVLYTLGLRARGGRILFDPNLRFEHDFSTMNDDTQRFKPLWKTYYHYRNLLMVYRLCAGWWFILVAPAVALKWVLKVHRYEGQRWIYLGLVMRALHDGFISRTSVDHADVLRWSGDK